MACPPARRPRCELRSARRLEARPGPATAHGHRSLGLWPFYPVADADWCVGPAPPMGAAAMLAGLAVSSMPAGLGLAHCATVSKWAAMGLCSMRSWLTECRRRVGVSSSASPLRVAVRSRFAVVSCPKCRPPRRKTLKTGCYGRGGLRFGRNGVRVCRHAALRSVRWSGCHKLSAPTTPAARLATQSNVKGKACSGQGCDKP